MLIPEKAETTVMASLVLQNLLWTKSKASYTTVGFTDQVVVDASTAEGIWRESGTSPNIAPLKILVKGRLNLKPEQTRETSWNILMNQVKCLGSGAFFTTKTYT